MCPGLFFRRIAIVKPAAFKSNAPVADLLLRVYYDRAIGKKRFLAMEHYDYIRKSNLLFKRIVETDEEGRTNRTDKFRLERTYDSISKAKRDTRLIESKRMGSVRRWESLEKVLGKNKLRGMIEHEPTRPD